MHEPAGLQAPMDYPKPLPARPEDRARWQHTAEARRILYERWRADLQGHIVRKVGAEKARRWGAPDMSANPLREINEEKACLYDLAPTVTHDDADAQRRMVQINRDSLIWQLAQRHQRDTLALGDSLIRIDATDAGAVYRQVFPDCVIGEADPDDPMRPLKLKEARLRSVELDGTRQVLWCWDALDISDPDNPSYRVRTITADPKQSRDVTAAVLGGTFDGDAYPYRSADGRPFLPYVLYHAQQTGALWDPYTNSALLEGTLNVGMYYTEYGHLLLQASHPQRYTVNAVPAGLNLDTGAESEMVTDPTTVVVMRVLDPDNGQILVGQWQAGGDPVRFLESIQAYERRLISKAGVKAAGATRSDGSPKSGYAISLSLEEKRSVARRVAPMFEAGDVELLTKTAMLLNRRAPEDKPDGWTDLPEDGWGIVHTGIPLSSEERKAQMEHVKARIEAGAINPIDAYVELNPGTTRPQAEAALQENQALRARFGL